MTDGSSKFNPLLIKSHETVHGAKGLLNAANQIRGYSLWWSFIVAQRVAKGHYINKLFPRTMYAEISWDIIQQTIAY